MIDIVERLRTEETDLFRLQETAADTIEALRRERAVLAVEKKNAVLAYEQTRDKLAAMTAERDELDKLYGLQFNENNDLVRERAASQACSQQLREHLALAVEYGPPMAIGNVLSKGLLALPQDDTALRQYGVKLLLDAAENIGYPMSAIELRRMAEEMK